MKRELVTPLATIAYKIYQTPTHSLTEKAAQFAACVAHIACSSHLPTHQADAFGCFAANNMMQLVKKSYQYSLMQAKNNFNLQQAKALQAKDRTPWIHQEKSLLKTVPHHKKLVAVNEHQHHLPLDSSNIIYPRAYCVAFVVFERASKINSQYEFENFIKKELLTHLADPFSYSEFFLQILKSREISAIMGVILILGLLLLITQPLMGIHFMPETTAYLMGGSMTSVGGIYHLWRFFSNTPAKQENAGDLLLTQLT